jgi:hypothetical protein
VAATIHCLVNEAADLATKRVLTSQQQLDGVRSDLAQLDEWLRVCEETRMLNEEVLPKPSCLQIVTSEVAPDYLKAAAEREDRDITAVQDSIFDAEGEVMKRINTLVGQALWTDDEADKEDCITIKQPTLAVVES